MRWRFVDRIEAFAPWEWIAGRKSVSFEEYGLLERLGREGSFPETLILECFVALGRWLVARSSDFQEIAWLGGVERFAVEGSVGPGDTIRTRLRVSGKDPGRLRLDGDGTCEDRCVARGCFALEIGGRDPWLEAKDLQGSWEKLHEPTSHS